MYLVHCKYKLHCLSDLTLFKICIQTHLTMFLPYTNRNKSNLFRAPNHKIWSHLKRDLSGLIESDSKDVLDSLELYMTKVELFDNVQNVVIKEADGITMVNSMDFWLSVNCTVLKKNLGQFSFSLNKLEFYDVLELHNAFPYILRLSL